MAYTLIGSERSPFVRICRMLLHQHHVDFDFRVLNFVDDVKAAAELERETPINKVPILIDNEQKIFDSRVIAYHLMRRHGWAPLSLDEENYLTAIYAAMDTAIILFLMKRDGFDLSREGFFLSRHRARIPSTLEYVMPWARALKAENQAHWNLASMALYSGLYWIEARTGLIKIRDYPDLAAFMERFQQAPGVRETSW
jgi:glutathione S-transferase